MKKRKRVFLKSQYQAQSQERKEKRVKLVYCTMNLVK